MINSATITSAKVECYNITKTRVYSWNTYPARLSVRCQIDSACIFAYGSTGNFRFVVCRVKPKSAHAPLCTLINICSECIISACSGFAAMSRPKVPETQPSPCVSVNQGGCSVSVVMLICACANIDLTTNLKFPVLALRFGDRRPVS